MDSFIRENLVLPVMYDSVHSVLVNGPIVLIIRAAFTTHELEWLEPWGKLAELELKCSNRELVYVGNTNVTQST